MVHLGSGAPRLERGPVRPRRTTPSPHSSEGRVGLDTVLRRPEQGRGARLRTRGGSPRGASPGTARTPAAPGGGRRASPPRRTRAATRSTPGRDVVMTTSYSKKLSGLHKGARISVVDVSDPSRIAYRHVLLVSAPPPSRTGAWTCVPCGCTREGSCGPRFDDHVAVTERGRAVVPAGRPGPGRRRGRPTSPGPLRGRHCRRLRPPLPAPRPLHARRRRPRRA